MVNVKEEEFKTIDDLKNYLIGDNGNISSLFSITRKNRVIQTMKSGYRIVNLSFEGKTKTFYIHRLVAQAHIPNPENKATVNHIDGDKSNNRVSNLEWTTRSENSKHGYDNGLIKIPRGKGESHATSKLTEKQVLEIRKIGKSKKARVLAKDFSVSICTIRDILYKKTWKHI